MLCDSYHHRPKHIRTLSSPMNMERFGRMSESVNFCDIHRPLCKNPQLFLEEFFNTQRDKFRWVFIADLQPVDFENFFLFNDGTFNGLQAYKNSKAANIMFVSELAKRLGDSGVKVNAVCPGKKNSLQFVMYE